MMESKNEVKFSADTKGGGAGGGAPPLPKDAQVMVAILKDMGINEFEPRVVNQLLEFSYRYATNILEDSKVGTRCPSSFCKEGKI